MATMTFSLSSPRWSVCKSSTSTSTSLQSPLYRARRRTLPSLQIPKGMSCLEVRRGVRAAVEAQETAAVPEGGEGEGQQQVEDADLSDEQQQAVSVPVSSSDKLLMYFKAEGTMNESAGKVVADALKETEGVIEWDVGTSEGVATVQLTKETTVQATGVASSLVETIQGAGFKLQSLSLSFEDDDDAAKRYLFIEPSDEME